MPATSSFEVRWSLCTVDIVGVQAQRSIMYGQIKEHSSFGHSLMVRLLIVLQFLIALCVSVQASWNKWEATNFCKCICFQSNYTILGLNIPDNPSQPCLSCTKQWCLNQNLPICAGASLGDTNPDTATGKEGDVEARCFQRDSPRDQFVVTLFLLTVFGLLLGAGVKNRMLKAGFVPELPWRRNDTRWWEPWIPGRQEELEGAPLGIMRFGLTAARRDFAVTEDSH